jgi:hypothetical protein
MIDNGWDRGTWLVVALAGCIATIVLAGLWAIGGEIDEWMARRRHARAKRDQPTAPLALPAVIVSEQHWAGPARKPGWSAPSDPPPRWPASIRRP